MTVARIPALALLGIGVLWAAAGPALAEDGAPADWWNEDHLQKHLEAACAAVEAVTGSRFGQRPEVHLSHLGDVMTAIQGHIEGERGVLEYAPDSARRFLAYYDPTRMQIHVLPAAFGAVAADLNLPDLLTEDVLRIILVHEVTHAIDFQTYRVRWMLECCENSDERVATEAILEGHAQLVTEEVARLWGIENAFRRLTQLYTGVVDSSMAPIVTGGPDQEAAFIYLQGHAFFREVQRVRGRAGVAAALRDPPFESRVIARPELWLHPERRGQEHDLQALLEVFRPLVPRGDWEYGKWRILRAPIFASATTDGHEMEGYLDNHGLYVGAPDGNRYLNVFIAQCHSEEAAIRFTQTLRDVDVARDEAKEWQPAVRRKGAGLGDGLRGFTSRRRATGSAPETEFTLQVARQGKYVLELTTYGLTETDPCSRARALDLAARLIGTPPPETAAVALRIHLIDFLTARARGKVDVARVHMRDLLPSKADLRRVVRPEYADAFAEGYTGTRLVFRTTPVSNATVCAAFGSAGPGTEVGAWGATTEHLARGEGDADHFPFEMRAFSREVAAPGMTWLVLSLRPREQKEPTEYACFVRFGDRFLHVEDPWTVLGK